MSMLKEFKEFALRGNVVDMAVGIVIGGAFGTIVNSLVKDIIMPVFGAITSGMDYSSKVLVLKDAVTDVATGKVTPAVTLGYGLFINSVISFIIVAFALFMVIKAMNTLKKKEAAAPAAPAAPPQDVVLLGEIRDLLKRR